MELPLQILKILDSKTGSSLSWISSKIKKEKDETASILTDLLKSGYISNGTCDDSACGGCGGGCDSMKMVDIALFTITEKGKHFFLTQTQQN